MLELRGNTEHDLELSSSSLHICPAQRTVSVVTTSRMFSLLTVNEV